MAKLYNIARMTTATTGTGTITLGSTVTGFISFATAGVTTGQTITYAIEDGDNREIGRGVYTASGTTLTRSVLNSTNGGSALNLSGSAQVFITAAAEDFNTLDNPLGSFGVKLASGTNVTANRTLTLTTGDADRTLNISAGSVTISAYGATLTDDADAPTARGTLGLATSTTAGRLGRYTGTTGATGQTTGIFEDGSGNVGVGTTSPQVAFHVGSTASIPFLMANNTSIGMQDSSGNNRRIYLMSSSNTSFIGPVDAGWGGSTLLSSGSDMQFRVNGSGGSFTTAMYVSTSGQVGIGSPASYQLHLSTDSAAKPSTNTWTISSDARLKENIVPADLARCWDIVKGIPLKRYTWRNDVYATETVKDRSKLGWIAQDVQPFFARAVETSKFEKVAVDDGVEEYQEQATATETITEEAVEIVDGAAVLVAREVERTVYLCDELPIVDASGQPIVDANGDQIMHTVPRMITKTRPKKRRESIDDCLSLNADQIYAAMYGALQLAMARIENLENSIAMIEGQAP